MAGMASAGKVHQISQQSQLVLQQVVGQHWKVLRQRGRGGGRGGGRGVLGQGQGQQPRQGQPQGQGVG
eukprot:3165814-Pleurochrysis_carterae.AAC.1